MKRQGKPSGQENNKHKIPEAGESKASLQSQKGTRSNTGRRNGMGRAGRENAFLPLS